MIFTEDTFEQAIIELFENMGYTHLYAPELERDYSSPFLDHILYKSVIRINQKLPSIEKSKKMLGQMESVLGADSTIQSLCEDVRSGKKKLVL